MKKIILNEEESNVRLYVPCLMERMGLSRAVAMDARGAYHLITHIRTYTDEGDAHI